MPKPKNQVTYKVTTINKEVPKSKKPYVKNCKSFFLTFSRCDYKMRTIYNKLNKIVEAKGRKITYFIICQEDHSDDKSTGDEPKVITHFHVMMLLDESLFFRDTSFFDVGKFHPNIQSPRNLTKVRDYILKGDNFLEIGAKWETMDIKKSPQASNIKRKPRFTKSHALTILLEKGMSQNTMRAHPEIMFLLKDIIYALKIYIKLEEDPSSDQNETISKSQMRKLSNEMIAMDKIKFEDTESDEDVRSLL